MNRFKELPYIIKHSLGMQKALYPESPLSCILCSYLAVFVEGGFPCLFLVFHLIVELVVQNEIKEDIGDWSSVRSTNDICSLCILVPFKLKVPGSIWQYLRKAGLIFPMILSFLQACFR